MHKVNLSDLAYFVNGTCVGDGDAVVLGVTTDSRTVTPGDLYVAIVGERVDGHDFVSDALAAGAIASLVTKPVDGNHVLVGQTVSGVDGAIKALGLLAKRERLSLSPRAVVGVTGSSGKTSTKDLIGHLLAAHGNTCAPVGSPNNELGLPMTILEASATTEYFVLEMGMRGLGDINYLCEIAAPSIAVVTNVGQAHIGELGSVDAIAQAKSELVHNLPVIGLAILNYDDQRVRAMAKSAECRVMTYGFSEQADIYASEIELTAEGGYEFTVRTPVGSGSFVLNLLGEHNVSNALAAIAVGIEVGMTLAEISGALSSVQQKSKWRMEKHQLPGDVLLINDAYNANPESMAAALKTLATIPHAGRTWAVLGTMHELGDEAVAEHDRIGRLAVRLDIGQVVVVGESARTLHLGATQEGSWDQESVWFPDFSGASDYIVERVAPGDVLLFKASRSEGFEQLAQDVEDRLSRKLSQRGSEL